jgi:hypothetical protein
MGQFSVEKPVAPGSVLSGNQQPFSQYGPDLSVNSPHGIRRVAREERTGDPSGFMKPTQESSTQEVLAGLVERVTFHNAENGFCVLRAKARGHAIW